MLNPAFTFVCIKVISGKAVHCFQAKHLFFRVGSGNQLSGRVSGNSNYSGYRVRVGYPHMLTMDGKVFHVGVGGTLS